MAYRNTCIIVVIAVLCSAGAAPLSAQEAAKGGAAKERIVYIEKALVDGQKNAQIWWGLWIAGYAGLSAGQYVLAGMADGYGRHEGRVSQFRSDFNLAQIGLHKRKTFPKKEQWVNYLVGGARLPSRSGSC